MCRLTSFLRGWLAAALLCAAACVAHGQVEVRMQIPRRLYLCYEPIVVTVSITNLSGRDLTLEDHGPQKWFSFEIYNSEEMPVPPTAADYHLDPLTIGVGQTVTRKVNLVSLYPVTDYGIYRVRAAIYMAALDKYFASAVAPVEITEGTQLWTETVGIPDGQKNAGQYRTYELLSFRQTKNEMLYARIEDKNAGIVYATVPLGRLVSGYPPDVQVDALSELHVLLMVAPKEYLYTRMGPNAELLGQDDYADLKTRPYLRKSADGDVTVAGGIQVEDKAASATAPEPKLSDRPAGMPAQ